MVIQVKMPTGTGALVVAGPGTPVGKKRGGGGAPATDPRTVANFEEITAIPFVLARVARHPLCHEAHVHMNIIYSDAFMDMGDLFAVTDPPTSTTFVADPVTIIKDKIREDSIIPNAVDTVRHSHMERRIHD